MHSDDADDPGEHLCACAGSFKIAALLSLFDSILQRHTNARGNYSLLATNLSEIAIRVPVNMILFVLNAAA